MPTVQYDFDETEELGDFVTLVPGRYVFEFVKAETGESKAGNPKAVVQLKVVAAHRQGEAFVGGVISQHWPTTGKAAFRFRAFLQAIGALKGKSKGTLKLERFYGKTIGAFSKLTEGEQTDEAGNPVYFNDLSQIVPGDQMLDLLEGHESEEDDEDEELEDEEVEVEDDEDDDEEFDEDEDDDEEEEGEEMTPEDLDDMSLAELRELAEEYGVSTRPPKGKKKLMASTLRKRLVQELWEDDEDEDDEEPF